MKTVAFSKEQDNAMSAILQSPNRLQPYDATCLASDSLICRVCFPLNDTELL